jgi:hypothetical protein
MSLAERLLAAFEGSIAGHGKTTVGRVGRTGKVDAKSLIVREQITEEKVQAHIEGKQGVGAIPINQDNLCKFGALDIDTYDLDHKALGAKIRKMKLPLLHCRSKSGGAHLFLFLKGWEPAALIREYLTEMSIALGFSGCEIFPKQDKILTERGDVGNFINMPYFNADETVRYCFNAKHEAMELEEFLDAVDMMRVSASDLNALKFGGERKHFTDGPYCLEIMSSQGKISENRNITMFAVGVYCKLKWPDDWKKHLEEYNRILCAQPLGASEIMVIQGSLEKKEYFYTCNTCPLKDFCDKTICKTRPFGVGSEEPDSVPLSGLTILLSEPRLYFMDVAGKRIELSTEQLQNQSLFQRACMDQIHLMPPLLKPAKWQVLIGGLMDQSTKLDVPEELTLAGQFKEVLKLYCSGRMRAVAPEEMTMGKPYSNNGRTNFTIGGLMDFLKSRGFSVYNRGQVQQQIKALNDGASCEGHYNIKKADGSPTTLRVFWVPDFIETAVFVDSEENNYDVPF